jgi:hypothetical protein
MGQPGENKAEDQDFGRWRREARRGEKSRGGSSKAEQGSGSKDRDQDGGRDQLVATSKLDHLVYAALGQKATVKGYHARHSSSTSSVSSKPHNQPEEEDPVDEGAKDEGGGGREGER